MYRLTSRLIIYRDIGEDSILHSLAEICRRFDKGDCDKEQLIGDIYEQIHCLLDVATRYGFNKNLWHNYLAYLIATTETPFTLVSEKVGANEGSVNAFALNDFNIFLQLFEYDFSRIEEALGINCFYTVEHYTAVGKPERVFNRSVSEKVQELSSSIEKCKDAADMYRVVTDFYRVYGVGKFGLNKAFRIDEEAKGDGLLIPITSTSNVRLDDLVGYELQKKKLVENTEAFVDGRAANNVLLYGDAGTGKSTSVKAILNQYYDRGLRMIEVYKHQFKCLSSVISQIKNRNYRFVLFMDDLSFEEFEVEYKYLKAVIEGGIETKPDNVLIYATSNRRHLVRESWHDKSGLGSDELHSNDTVQEKLSLSARFGCSIGYFKPSPKEFQEIVTTLASRYPEIHMTNEELLREANKWEMSHGGFSGRTAQQFINYLAGRRTDE